MPEVKCVDGTWRFEYTPSEAAALKQLRRVWDRRTEDSAELTDLVSEHLKVLEEHPDLVEGHRMVAIAYHRVGNLQDDGAHLHLALASAEKAIKGRPCVFDSEIADNWTFLRAVEDLSDFLWQTHATKASVELTRRRVSWTENDTNRIRLQLAHRLLREHRSRHGSDEAIDILGGLRTRYPSAYYELGLARIMEASWARAAAELRLGLLANPYIAEALLFGPGSSWPLPLMLGSGDHRGRTAAHVYATTWRSGWQAEGLYFLRWVQSYPPFVIERARVQSFEEQLRWADSACERRELIEKRNSAIAEIKEDLDKTSAAAVEPRVRAQYQTIESARRNYLPGSAAAAGAQEGAESQGRRQEAAGSDEHAGTPDPATRETFKPWEELGDSTG